MFCGECGTDNPETNSFCRNCGHPLRKAGTREGEAHPPGSVPASGPVPQQLPGSGQVQASPEKSWSRGKKFAAGSIVLGIVSFIVIPYIPGLAGIILGVVAVRDHAYAGVLGIILSLIAMLVSFFYIFLVP